MSTTLVRQKKPDSPTSHRENRLIHHQHKRGQGRIAFLFVLPFFILFALALAAPIIYSIYCSFFTNKRSGLGFGGTTQIFAGLGNYIEVLTDSKFLHGFVNLAGYVIGYVPIMLGMAVVFAMLIDSATAVLRRTFQFLLFLPHAVPGVIAAVIWSFLYTPAVSPIVQVLSNGGIQIDFLSAHWVLPSIINVSVWEWTGYNVIILFTALQAIDKELIEAAVIDGASGWRISRSIKLPLIRPSVMVALLFTIIGTLQLFTEPTVLRAATSNISTAFVPTMWAYDAAFNRNNLGQAAAASVIIALLAGVLSFLVMRTSNRKSAQ